MEFTFTELFWLLLIYSFIGWIIEAAVGTIKNRRFTNRGFSTGPFCLVYGVAAVLMTLTLSELMDSPGFQFIGCGILATVVEWITGKSLELVNRRKWWDYSNKKFNFDGYICLQYTLLWAVLGIITLRYGNVFFMFLYNLMLSLIGFVERRMARAYPVIAERTEEILKEGRFAEGCGFYKLFWLFLVGAFLGDITETIFCRLTSGVWMSRSSLVWGPFSIVWGIAIALATALLYKDRDKADRHIFFIGAFLGGAYEYVCSVFTELVFGQVFWDYSKIPFNLGGRVNLLYCFFWGIAAVVWIKGLYPYFSRWIEKIPKIAGYIASWILIIFMTADILISSAALIRYSERAGGPAADSGWEQIIDTNFDDQKMEQIYPNAKAR